MIKYNLKSEEVHDISELMQHIGFLSLFGFYDTLDYFVANVRQDSSDTMLIALLRTTSLVHRQAKLPSWREGRNRIYKIVSDRGNDADEELIGLMEL